MARLASLGVALLSCVACAAIPGLGNDTFQDWSAVPLPPDERLTGAAGPACRGDGEPPRRLVLLDRRTARTALVVYDAGESFGYCVESAGSGFAIVGEGALPAREADALTVDHAISADGPGLTAALGRVPEAAVRVEVRPNAGRVAEASVSDGVWAAWFPGHAATVTAIAFDRRGTEIARVTRPTQ